MIRQVVISLVMVWILGLAPLAQHPPQKNPAEPGSIEGRVLDAEGKAIAKAKVYSIPVNQPQPGRLPYTYTDEQGKFFLPNVRPGVNTVHAVKEESGYPDTFFAFFVVSPKTILKVAVDAGQTTKGVIVRLGPKAGRLIGQVVDAETDAPVQNARLTLRRADNPDNVFSASLKYPEARFDMLVPSVGFTLSVFAPGYKIWEYENARSEKRTDVMLIPPSETKELVISLNPIN